MTTSLIFKKLKKRHIRRIDDLGETLLFKAVKMGRLKDVQRLVQLGAELSHHNFNGQSVLHVAAIRGHTDIVEYLVAVGVSLNDPDISGSTALAAPLHNTAGWLDIRTFPSQLADRHKAVVLCLIEAGASINCLDISGQTALHIAIRSHGLLLNDYYLSSLLVCHGSDVNRAGKHMRDSPLALVCRSGTNMNVDFVRLLLEAGATIDPWLRDVCSKHKSEQPLHLQSISEDLCHNAGMVPSLQQSCRLLLRRCLHPRLYWRVDQLPLSNQLKNFLKLTINTSDSS